MTTRRGLRSGSRAEDTSIVEVNDQNAASVTHDPAETTPITEETPAAESLAVITEGQTLASRKGTPAHLRNNSTPESDSDESPIRDPAGQNSRSARPHFDESPIDELVSGSDSAHRREMNQLRDEMNAALTRVQKDVERITVSNQEALRNGLRAVHEHLRQSEERTYINEADNAGFAKNIRMEIEEMAKIQKRGQAVMEENLMKLTAEMSEIFEVVKNIKKPETPSFDRSPLRSCLSSSARNRRPDEFEMEEPPNSSTRLPDQPRKHVNINLGGLDDFEGPIRKRHRSPAGDIPTESLVERMANIQVRQMERMLVLMEASQRTADKVAEIHNATVNQTGARAEGGLQHRFKPDKYSGAVDGSIDSWLTLMKIHLSQQESMDEREKTFLVISFLAKEARTFVLNKPEGDRNNVERLFDLLSRRFGSGSGRAQARAAFSSRRQQASETINLFLDELEGLRIRAYPDEERATRDYEILQRFIHGVRDSDLQVMLLTKYNDEKYVTEPPTVEDLRYVTNDYLRVMKDDSRPVPSRAVGSYPRPVQRTPYTSYANQPTTNTPGDKLVDTPAPINQDPNAKEAHTTPVSAPPLQRTVRPGTLCFTCGKAGHYAADCDQQKATLKAIGLSNDQIEAYCQSLDALNRITTGSAMSMTTSSKVSSDSQPDNVGKILFEKTAESMTPAGKVFIVNAGRESREVKVTIGDTTFQQHLNPISDTTVIRKDVYLKATKTPPNLTFPKSEETLALRQKRYRLEGPIEASLVIDGAELRTKVLVVVDTSFPESLVVGRNDLCKQGLRSQMDLDGTIGLDDDSTVLIPFHSSGGYSMLKGLIDTGAGPSIMGISAWKKLGLDVELHTKHCSLLAVNGKPITTHGMADSVKFHIAGLELETSFIIVQDLLEEDFILGRTFIRAHDVLVDLNQRRMTIRRPDPKPVAVVGEDTPVAQLFLRENMEVPPQDLAVCALTAKYDPENPLLNTDVMIWSEEQNQFVIGRTLATVDSRGDTFATILNISDVPLKLERGTFVANCAKLETHYLEEIIDSCVGDGNNNRKENLCSYCSSSTPTDILSGKSHFPTDAYHEPPDPQKLHLPDIEKLKDRLEPEQFQELGKLLQEFESIFQKHKADLGRCTLIEHKIDLEPNAVPWREGPRRMTPFKTEKANEEVRMLIEMGVIEPSYSPWACGIVMAKKKGNQLRMCCDFRNLNAQTIKDAFPLPRIDECLSKLGSARFFSCFDLASAFWQVPLRKGDEYKTAFACELGLFHWLIMPYGLCNSPPTFQRMMSIAFERIMNRYGSIVLCYIDDVIIATETLEEHFVRLREVLTCIKDAGLKLKPTKCEILKESVKYLGRIIDETGVYPDPEQVQTVQDWHVPRNHKEMQSFLGLTNYYREFIVNYAEKAKPLTDLTKTTLEYVWSPEAQTSFELLKKELCSAPVLALPNEEGMFYLDTDASEVAISGILHQEQEWNGKKILRPVCYGSRVLNAPEQRYGAPKAEMLAVVFFVEKYRCFLAGRKFILRVDNQALSWLKTYSMDLGMIGRWITRLDQYYFEIQHRDRNKHQNADSLSKKTEFYEARENMIADMPKFRTGVPFMSKQQYDELPLVEWIDKNGREILDHPNRPLPQRAPDTIKVHEVNGVVSSVSKTCGEEKLSEPSKPIEFQHENEEKPKLKMKRGQKYSVKDLRKAQESDCLILAIKTLMEGAEEDFARFPKGVRKRAKQYYRGRKKRLYVNSQGVLCCERKTSEKPAYQYDLIVLPQFYQPETIRLAHNGAAHQGIHKVCARILQRFEWPGMYDAVNKWISTCVTCQEAKTPKGLSKFPLKPIESYRFGEIIQMDFTHFSQTTNSGYTQALVIIDHYTKYAEAAPCGISTAEIACDLLLRKWFARHGTPAYVQCDNGPEFASKLTELFLQAGMVITVHSTPIHPGTNGSVERQNRTLKNLLKVFGSRYVYDWDIRLDEVLGIYNGTVHSTTGVTPYQLLTGKEKTTPLSYIFPEYLPEKFRTRQDYIQDTLQRQQELHRLVRHNTQQAQRRQKKYFDQRLKEPVAYHVGQLVWVFTNSMPKKGSPKLNRGWRGPFAVVEVHQNGRVYTLENGQKVHFERLKMHMHDPTDWVILEDGEIAFILNEEAEEPEEEIPVTEDAESYAEEEPLKPASEERLPIEIPREKHPMMTRERKKILEGGERKTFTHFGRNDPLDLFEDPPLSTDRESGSNQGHCELGECGKSNSNEAESEQSGSEVPDEQLIQSRATQTSSESDTTPGESPNQKYTPPNDEEIIPENEQTEIDDTIKVKQWQLNVSMHSSCDSNASTVPLEGEAANWRRREMLMADDEIDPCLVLDDETEQDHSEETLPYAMGKFTELPRDGNPVEQWIQRSLYYWSQFPPEILSPLEKDEDIKSPESLQTLVGTPTNSAGGGEVKDLETQVIQRIRTMRIRNKIDITGLIFCTEKIWHNPDNGTRNEPVRLLFKEEGQRENQLVLAMQAVVPFESEKLLFSHDEELGPETIRIHIRSNEFPKPTETLRAINLDVTERTDERTVRLIKNDIELFVKLENGACDPIGLEQSLKEIKSLCEEKGVKTIVTSVLEICAANLNFGHFYTCINTIFQESEIVWHLVDKNDFQFVKPIELSQIAEELSQLQSLNTENFRQDLARYSISDKPFQRNVEKPVGYEIEFRLPRDFIPYDACITLSKDDFITQSRNPVICIPADCKPRGGMAKAFFRELKPSEELFNQKIMPGGVALLSPNFQTNQNYVFFCITRTSAKDEFNAELYYKCLLSLRDLVLDLRLNQIAIPLLDWDRDFLTLDRHYKLLQNVFSGIEIDIILHSYYFLTIK